MLVHLKDACSRYRTKDFLWEFCFEKYLRQYDDELTFRNVNKKKKELYFLGYFNPQDSRKYSLRMTESTGHYQPEREFLDEMIRFEIPGYRYVSTIGRMARIYNMKNFAAIKLDEPYILTVHIPRRLLKGNSFIVDCDGKTMEHYETTNRMT